jgi:hypothetical protein
MPRVTEYSMSMLIEHPAPATHRALAPAEELRCLGEVTNAAGDTKVEVVLRAAAGEEPLLELVEYSWGSGLGWYSRKRLTLDAAQGAALAGMLGAQFAPKEAPVRKRRRPAIRQEGNVVHLLFAEG